MLEQLLQYRWIIIFALGLLCIIIILLLTDDSKKKKKVKKQEPTKEASELELVLKAMEDNSNQKKAVSFEQEQEENAIISYQELLAVAHGGNASVQENDAMKEIEESILASQIAIEENALEENTIENDITNSIENEVIIPNETTGEDIISEEDIKEEPKKFKNSEFISPVFGREKPKETNDDFLKALKDFRSNL